MSDKDKKRAAIIKRLRAIKQKKIDNKEIIKK